MSRGEANAALGNTPDGSFLVRLSKVGTRRGEHALSIKWVVKGGLWEGGFWGCLEEFWGGLGGFWGCLEEFWGGFGGVEGGFRGDYGGFRGCGVGWMGIYLGGF